MPFEQRIGKSTFHISADGKGKIPTNTRPTRRVQLRDVDRRVELYASVRYWLR